MKKLLHVGCGTFTKEKTIPYFFSDAWQEIRFDIDPNVKPDIVGSLIDMSALETESVDAIYSSHNIEHVFEHEVAKVLSEFLRVLKKDGFLVLTCPDLQSLCKFIGERGIYEVAYESPSGPILAHDILYGYGQAIKNGNYFMAHKCGLDSSSMHQKLAAAGYADFVTIVSEPNFALWVVARKSSSLDTNIDVFGRSVLSGLPYFGT